MTTLTELIERAQKAHTALRAAKPGTEGEANAVDNRLLAERTLLNHLYAHATYFAEREHLERAYVAAHRAFWRIGGSDGMSNSEREQAMLAAQFDLLDWLRAHADDGAAP